MKQEMINICIASDNNYAPLIATTIASVCTNTKRFIKFWCLENAISSFNKKLINGLHERFGNFEIEYISIDKELIESFASKLARPKHISADTYSRLFIPDLFSHLEKMIYLDVDLIVLGDIGELYDVDLTEYALGAVSADYGEDRTQWAVDFQMKAEHHYFNAGVLLMNPKKLKEDNFLEKMKKIAQQFGQFVKICDQDLLNKYCDANYLELPWRFNLTTRFIEMELASKSVACREKMQNEYKNCVVRHFESQKKPWNAVYNCVNNMVIKNAADFWAVAQMTPYLSWFQTQFNAAQMETVQQSVLKEKVGVTTFKLFGFLPVIQLKHKKNKSTYRLFKIIPLISVKNKK